MSSQRLNAAEKDLEKFIKFLALKSTQVVVQSRLGEKIQTQCNPLAGNDWFNIVVQDHPDVYAETKRALALNPGDSILQRLPLCIEISLKTVEGDQMVLEVWSLDLTPYSIQPKEEKTDVVANATVTTNANVADQQTLRAAHSIYNRMGILLKSLISLTRATPAYKLSRRQCPESYGIYYRIYVDRPKTHTLGEGHKKVKIGQLHTIVGSLTMSVAYRTKMTITPTASQAQNTEANTIMVKSDHFRPSDSSSPNHHVLAVKKSGIDGGHGAEQKYIDIEKPLRPGAFTDIGKLRQYTENDYVLPETPPFEWLLRRTRLESNGSGSIESLNNRKCGSPVFGNNGQLNNNNYNIQNFIYNNNNNNNNVSSYKSLEKNSENKSSPQANIGNTFNFPKKSLLITVPIATRHSSAPTLPPSHPPDDDSLLKELNFPFASPTSHVNDLAKFYRDCYHAPPLRGMSDLNAGGTTAIVTSEESTSSINTAHCTDSNTVDDLLSRQLEQFETSLEDYDKLVSQFGLTASSSTGSRSSGGLQMSN